MRSWERPQMDPGLSIGFEAIGGNLERWSDE